MKSLQNAAGGIRRSFFACWLTGLSLFVCAAALAQQPAPAADPAVWGIYARLVGTRWSGAGEGVTVGGIAEWQWATADTIVEKRQYYKDQIISRGANPGELVAVYGSGIGTATYDGRIAADGSVLWIRRGLIKTPMRSAIVDGRYREELVKLDDAGQITKIKSTGWYSQTSGQSASVPIVVATAPAAKPAVTAAASLTTPSAVPAPSPAPVAIPPAAPAPFGDFERFVGKHLYSQADRDFLEFTRGPDNSLVVESHPLEGNSYYRYVLAESKKKPGAWELLDAPGGPKFARDAEWKAADRFELWAKDAMYPSWMVNYEFHIVGDTVYAELYMRQFNVIGLGTSNTRNKTTEYQLISDATIAQMHVDAEENRRAWAKLQAEQPKKTEAQLYAERMAVLAELAKNTDSYEAENYAEYYGLPYTPPDREAPKPAAWYQALQDLNAAASASEARSRAALDATMQQAAQQAAYERQQAADREQAAANARYAEDARRAREATERQYEIARQFEAQQQAKREEAARIAAANTAAPSPGYRPAGTSNSSSGTTQTCPVSYKSGVASSIYSPTQADAERGARRDMELQCPGAAYTSDSLQCSVKKLGDVVNIDSKGHATKTGENTAWICSANYRCTNPTNQCWTGPGKGSAQ